MKAETNTTPTLDPLGEVRSYTVLARDHAAAVREIEALRLERAKLRVTAQQVIADCKAVGVIPFHLNQLCELVGEEPA